MRLSIQLRSIAGSVMGSVALFSAGNFTALPGNAQTLSVCDPPEASEYLLLVLNQTPETEAQITQLLPENAAISTCNYLNEEVVRVGGFASAEIANAWAQYLNDTAGLQAFVASPTVDSTSAALPPSEEPASAPESTLASPTPSDTAPSFPSPTQLPAPSQASPAAEPTSAANEAAPVATAPTPPSSAQGYNPQPLGDGYAVLVNYFNRPEVAADVRQVTAQAVGLVSYEQSPFLLAAHTSDSAAATAVSQALTQRGFTAIVVDSRRAILLTPFVAGTEE